MKLNINPKELLALHNLLRDATSCPPEKHEPGVDPVPDDVHLRQLYARVRSYISASLGRGGDPIEHALSHEQAKIDRLKVDLVDIEKERAKLFDAAAKRDKDYLVPDRDEDLVVPEYPSRPRRAHGGGQGRKK